MLPPWSALTWNTSCGPPCCGPRNDQPGTVGKGIAGGGTKPPPPSGGPASGGPASGGPASGGPASGGPASGGPASGRPPSVSGGPPSRSGTTSPEPPLPHAQTNAADATATAHAPRHHFMSDLQRPGARFRALWRQKHAAYQRSARAHAREAGQRPSHPCPLGPPGGPCPAPARGSAARQASAPTRSPISPANFVSTRHSVAP